MTFVSSALLPVERQNLILGRLQAEGRVLAADLAREFGATEDTIRRDLRDMAARGDCRRVYGGALPASPASAPLEERERQSPERKAALGRAAAALVQPGQLLFIDAGSTNLAIAHALPDHAELAVATNAPSIAVALIGRPGVSVILIGGPIDPLTGGAAGSRAVRDVEALRIDLCFLGACQISAEAGVSAFLFEDAELKRTLVRASQSVAVAVTTEKFGTGAPYRIASPGQLHHLVLERDAAPEAWEPFARAGVKIHQPSA